MTQDNLATVDTDEGIEKFLMAADALEAGLSYFRASVWRALPFDFKRDHAETMRFLSERIAAAAERLRDADRELRLAVEIEKDLTAELKTARDNLAVMDVLAREQAE